MNSFTDYYAVLGVAVDAPPDRIKAAFKKLALQYHPDVYKGEDAHERMSALLLAYQTLNAADARRKYDAQRSEHIQDGQRYRSAAVQGKTMGSNRSTPVSPGARRDRQRHYAFPDFPTGRSVSIDLVDFIYTLSSSDAHLLQQQGMLRGVAPANETRGFYCHRCHHHWSIAHSGKNALPLACPTCRATDWSEYLLLRCVHCCAVFESEQIRYEVASMTYGASRHMDAGPCPPYELFPLCPYCGTAHWCPSEETRVNELRVYAARRAATLRTVWIGVIVMLVVAVGIAAFVLH